MALHSLAAPTDLHLIEELVVRMFALISEGLAAANEAFLGSDRGIARNVVAGDRHIDDLQRELEELVERNLLHAAELEPQEVRLLISVLRIAPELERSGDLIEHIALRTPQRLTDDISPRGRGLLAEMGRVAPAMWREAANAYIDRDPAVAERLRVWDDELDDLHVELTEELASGAITVPVAIEIGLVARFYERLGDHAVNVARRIRYLTDG